MPTVDENRLKGNYGAAYVSACLSSECLVRPVAAETDVGVDLYCETVEDGRPFLHFWVQVKAGAQCRLAPDLRIASCSFTFDHLEYWYRQPVPVFAALVPVDWPVREEPDIYIMDITSQLLGGVPGERSSVTLRSDSVWRRGNRDDIKQFLTQAVPAAAARLQCRNGIVASMPTLRPSYLISSPLVPVKRFKESISDQVRRTAALSIMFLHAQSEMGADTATFRQTMASVVEQFADDPHWENFMARALSYHADKSFDRAIEFYDKAIRCIQNDSNVATLEPWKKRVREIEKLRERARRQDVVNGAD